MRLCTEYSLLIYGNEKREMIIPFIGTWLPSAEYVCLVLVSGVSYGVCSPRRVLGTIVAVVFAIGYACIAGPHDSLLSRG